MPTADVTYTREILTQQPEVAVVVDALRKASNAVQPSDVIDAFGQVMRRWSQPELFVTLSTRGLSKGRFRVTRTIDSRSMSSEQRREKRLQDTWRMRESFSVHDSGLLADIISVPEPQFISGLDLATDPVLGSAIAGISSCVAIPHYEGGDALNWAMSFFVNEPPRDAYPIDQIILVSSLIGKASGAAAALRDVRELNDQLESHLNEVARVQRSLLPKTLPEIPGYAIDAFYQPSLHAGGDYYDFIPLADGRCAVLIADVSGHGPGAATVMAMLHAVLHAYAHEIGGASPDGVCSPERFMAFVNRRLCASLSAGTFVTAFVGVLDPRTGELVYSTMGHPPVRHKRGIGIAALNDASNVPLAIVPNPPITSARMQLDPGDTIVLYTDGIIEAFSPHREMFGTGRLDDVLEQCTGEPSCVIQSVTERVREFAQRLNQEDDQTLVVIQRSR